MVLCESVVLPNKIETLILGLFTSPEKRRRKKRKLNEVFCFNNPINFIYAVEGSFSRYLSMKINTCFIGNVYGSQSLKHTDKLMVESVCTVSHLSMLRQRYFNFKLIKQCDG